MKVCVILPAAGLGRRFGNSDDNGADQTEASANKLEQRLGDQPLFLRTVNAFVRREEVSKVLLAVPPDGVEEFRFRWGDRLSLVNIEIVAGGRAERWETVAKALVHVPEQTTHIAVHDAARPLVSQALLEHVFEAVTGHSAVIPATEAANTLKRVKPQDAVAADQASVPPQDPADAILGRSTTSGSRPPTVREVVETVSRKDLIEAQTPQVFEASLLHRAYQRLVAGKVDPTTITDDAGVVEALGERVYVVEGQSTNLKITRQEDLDLARALVSRWDAASAKEEAASRLFRDDDEDDR